MWYVNIKKYRDEWGEFVRKWGMSRQNRDEFGN